MNTGASAVDVSSWSLSDGFGVRHTFPVGSSIPAGCAIVVFSGGTPTGLFGLAVVQTASSGQLGLNNGGDDITLRDGSSTVIASYTYGAEGGNNASLTRDPDITGSFVLHSAATNAGGTLFSPGTRNDGSSFAGCQVDPCPLADDGIANFDENTCACELGYFATLETVGPDQVITACTVCPPGRYCPDGIAVLLCAAGAFQAVEGQTACLPCTAGTYNPVEGATSCLACDAGTYNGNVGATACSVLWVLCGRPRGCRPMLVHLGCGLCSLPCRDLQRRVAKHNVNRVRSALRAPLSSWSAARPPTGSAKLAQ
ncbi:MAG: lamin tail domain-containing protein [Flavobacteriales bacterium]|nr:lamin tail domain-containing protein [Flavobacteriales bacterium]